jgi:Rod binding domain-containing protein
MLKVMRETIPKGTLTENRMGEMFHTFYDEAISKAATQSGGIGLAQYIEARLRQDQENIVKPNDTGNSS